MATDPIWGYFWYSQEDCQNNFTYNEGDLLSRYVLRRWLCKFPPFSKGGITYVGAYTKACRDKQI